MLATISNIEEKKDVLNFQINNIDISVINSLRRTILADIPIVVFKTFPYSKNQCTIYENTSHLNNEIIKHRLSLIPIHITDKSIPLENYNLEINITNNTKNIKYVTTEDFKIKDITTNKYISNADNKDIFPPNKITGDYIDFVRLKPNLADNINGEKLHLTSKLSIGTADEDGSYNCVSICTYSNTCDTIKQNTIWSEKAKELSKDPDIDIEYEKKNWYLLEGLRCYIQDSYQFKLKSIGIYDNRTIIKTAIKILINKCNNFITDLNGDNTYISISESDNSIAHSYDIKLVNEDYTLGKVLELLFYNLYYEGNKTINFCGFIIEHPHDNFCIIRIAFKNITDPSILKQMLSNVFTETIKIYNHLETLF